MNIKELADNATHYAYGIYDADANADWYEVRDTKFAELVADAERQASAKRYHEIMHDVVTEAVAKEREACAKLCEEQDEYGCGQYAKAIRARGGA